MTKPLDEIVLAKLVAAAKKGQKNAYAPYSHFPVGAAILSGSGKIYIGANCELANYDSTCAERSAISAMTVAGERKVKAVVVIGSETAVLVTPCGRCRQSIREFSDQDALIYSLWANGTVGQVMTMDELLPHSFGPENLA